MPMKSRERPSPIVLDQRAPQGTPDPEEALGHLGDRELRYGRDQLYAATAAK